MTTFALGAAVLILLAWWLLSPGWRLAKTPPAARALHLLVLDEQLAALDREHAAGQFDAEQHRIARLELQRRMLEETAPSANVADRPGSRRTIVAVSLAVPLFAVALYAVIGNVGGLAPQAASPPQAAGNGDVSPEAVEAMLTMLATRLEKSSGNPETDLKGWTMLGRSYAALQRFADADRALARAVALAPNDPQLLADRADVLAMVQGQRMAGEPERLVATALKIDPRNLKALALAGSGAFERKDYAAARAYWQQARSLAPAGSEFAAGLDRSLDDARVASGEAPASVATPAATMPSASASGGSTAPAPTAVAAAPGSDAQARISGKVSLAPALAAKVAPTDTVFIFARAAQGPRMPLAILKRTVADLPFTFTLDDSQAMSPQMKLSGFDRVVVGARVSRSGNAMPQPGDLKGESAATGTRVEGLQLVIDNVQP